MRLLLSWLREYVDAPADAGAIADALSMRGFELAGIEAVPAGPDAAGRTPAGEDAVIDVEVTANRPDCLSLLGLAREVSTIYGVPLRVPAPDGRPAPPAGAPLEVTIEEPELCPRYAVEVLTVTVAPSPAWLARRLHAAGVRPINTVVDVTNYVLLELGHPTHAFDLERLAGPALRIRRARAGERLRTLDGIDRTLHEDMLIIADAGRPQAVAGVMGGADSEVTTGTRTVALESAYFQPASVRRTSRRLGLKTEASTRFERGADIAAPAAALDRVRAVLELIGAGRGGPRVDRYPAPRRPAAIVLRHDRVARVVGQPVEAADTARILEGLGFDVRRRDAERLAWDVAVPTARVDVSREIDLIEEVARHSGYDRLPATFPALRAPVPPPDPRIEQARLARRVLTAAGCSEAVTFTFIDQAAAAAFAAGAEVAPIANPLSEKFAVLRPWVVAGLIDAVAHNRRRERRDVRLFEIGTRFGPAAGEQRAIGIAWTGAGGPEHWTGGRTSDLFDIKGAVERLCDAFGVSPVFEAATRRGLAAGRTASIAAGGADRGAGALLGFLGELTPDAAVARGLPAGEPVYVAELDFDRLVAAGRPRDEGRMEPLPRHPSVVRDLSILVDEALPAATVRGTIRAAAPGTLVDVREFDRYQGRGVPAGRVSLSLRLTFRAPDRTLTDGEVQQATDRVLAALVEAHGAVQR